MLSDLKHLRSIVKVKDTPDSILVASLGGDIDLALRVADYAYVLDRGRVALQGQAGEVRGNPELMRYLAP